VTETIGVSLTHKVVDGVTRELAKLAARIKNIDAAFEDMGASIETETKQRFEVAKSPEGEPWKGLAESTLLKRGRVGDGGKAAILQDQRHLFESITHKVQPGIGTMVGTSMIYGRIHQLGGMAGRGRKVKIDARPYLGLSEEGRREMVEILKDHVGRGVG
jgi:phage virion morphogenesis protein